MRDYEINYGAFHQEYYAAVFYKAVFQCTYMESSLSYKFKKIKDTKQ